MFSATLAHFFPKLPSRKSNLEWIGGRRTMPVGVLIDGEVHHTEVFLWLERPSGLAVGMTPVDPRAPISFGQSLVDAMNKPAEGAARCPARIRVADESMADEVRRSIGNASQVTVAACPEIDEAFDELVQTVVSTPFQTYLGQGRVDPQTVHRLFLVAARLFRAAPWRDVCEDQLVEVDIPAFDVESACLSVIGGGKEDYGLVLFRSFEDYLHFASNPPTPAFDDVIEAEGETTLLSLSFDRKKEMPPAMLDEIAKYGWPVAGSKAYPVVLAIDRDAKPQRVDERSVRTLTALTDAFLQFFSRHRGMFQELTAERISEEILTEEGIAVTLTAPFEDFSVVVDDEPLEEDDGWSVVPMPRPPARSAPRAGRNDPCPCGSGKKYKKCHLDADSIPSPPSEADRLHEMDRKIILEIARFATRHGDDWPGPAVRGFEMDSFSAPLFIPWVTYTVTARGKRVAETFLEERGRRLAKEEADWLRAQLGAWISVWEVRHREQDVVEVLDLLTGERRSVRVPQDAEGLVGGDVALARIIEYDGISLFAGIHGHGLSPEEAEDVVRAVRSKLGIPSAPVPIDRLRDEKIGRFMLDRWEDALSDAYQRHP